MKIDNFIDLYTDPRMGSGYDPGEVPEYSRERVEKMLKDLLHLVAQRAKVKTRYEMEDNGGKFVNLVDEEPEIDKNSILNIFEDEK